MLDRRDFLKVTGAAGAGMIVPVRFANALEAHAQRAGVAAVGASPPLTKWVDAVPIAGATPGDAFAYTPSIINGVSTYDIPIGAFTQKLHRDLPPTYLWGYGGTFPSRSIIAKVGEQIQVRWRNLLDPKKNPHPLATSIDYRNLGGMVDPVSGQRWPDQRITTHLHGGHVQSHDDGGPKTWYTGPFFSAKNYSKPGTSVIYDGIYNGDVYNYPNNQQGTTLWYHDHAMGITRLNVYAGLAGFWILRDPLEDSVFGTLGLPRGPFEIPLVFQDRTFNADGSLYYAPAPEVPEFFGDTMLVNGKVWPFLEVEPRQYRFRFLNGCNARFLRMQMIVSDAAGVLPTSTRYWVNNQFVQIGAEGGLFDAPTAPFNTLLMAPAERADVIIDFSNFVGQSILLYNDASTPFGNTASSAGAIPEVMLFRVKNTAKVAPVALPANFTSYGLGAFQDANHTLAAPDSNDPNAFNRFITLDEITDPTSQPAGMLKQLLNMQGYEASDDPVTLGRNEIWWFINTTVDVHPIHMHQSMFKVLSRQPFNTRRYAGDRAAVAPGSALDPRPYLTGTPSPPQFNEVGWKDTIRANPGEVARLAVKFVDYTGIYVYHCHILEHEEHDMMHQMTINASAV